MVDDFPEASALVTSEYLDSFSAYWIHYQVVSIVARTL